MTNAMRTQTNPAANDVTAAELMTPNPVSIRAEATVREVVAFLTETGFSAAPVIDEAGRPVGVVSRTDVVVYDRALDLAAEDSAGIPVELPPEGGLGEKLGALRAADLMNVEIFAVRPQATAVDVAREMVRQNVHRLYVVDGSGILVGVISALDLLRHFSAP